MSQQPQASSSQRTPQTASPSIIEALHMLIRGNGATPNSENIAKFLAENLPNLISQGHITEEQALQLHEIKAYLAQQATQGEGLLFSETNGQNSTYPINSSVQLPASAPVPWTQARPTLTGGFGSQSRLSSTPAMQSKGTDDAILAFDDNRPRKRNTPGDQSMRKTIQDLVSSVDPNVRIEPEVEDLLLSIADEFIDSVANFACRLAKHRGGDTLEVRDLQLHLERNHNIRIPGFSDGDSRISLASAVPTPSAAAQASNRRGAATSGMTLRSQRLAQVQADKRQGKNM
ncbi:transcription initiation factor TFIID subunit A-domain-containing protein [Flagelloscypha sp. PMI_526]|nr:transcription initiation factor TFIID subunit A-domain-containing protein [Flagelloscypha sp. PMI_526]